MTDLSSKAVQASMLEADYSQSSAEKGIDILLDHILLMIFKRLPRTNNILASVKQTSHRLRDLIKENQMNIEASYARRENPMAALLNKSKPPSTAYIRELDSIATYVDYLAGFCQPELRDIVGVSLHLSEKVRSLTFGLDSTGRRKSATLNSSERDKNEALEISKAYERLEYFVELRPFGDFEPLVEDAEKAKDFIDALPMELLTSLNAAAVLLAQALRHMFTETMTPHEKKLRFCKWRTKVMRQATRTLLRTKGTRYLAMIVSKRGECLNGKPGCLFIQPSLHEYMGLSPDGSRPVKKVKKGNETCMRLRRALRSCLRRDTLNVRRGVGDLCHDKLIAASCEQLGRTEDFEQLALDLLNNVTP